MPWLDHESSPAEAKSPKPYGWDRDSLPKNIPTFEELWHLVLLGIRGKAGRPELMPIFNRDGIFLPIVLAKGAIYQGERSLLHDNRLAVEQGRHLLAVHEAGEMDPPSGHTRYCLGLFFNNLAAILTNGLGVHRDRSLAYRFALAAEDHGEPSAGVNIANLGWDIDPERAKKSLLHSQEQGCATAKAVLGFNLVTGQRAPWIEKNPQEGIRLLEEATAMHNPDAMTWLGLALLSGKHASMDITRGWELIRNATLIPGGDRAKHILGKQLCYGHYVRQDAERGLRLLHDAANNGIAESQWELSRLYQAGNLVPRDEVTAFEYARLASEGGCRPAKEWLAEKGQKRRAVLWS